MRSAPRDGCLNRNPVLGDYVRNERAMTRSPLKSPEGRSAMSHKSLMLLTAAALTLMLTTTTTSAARHHRDRGASQFAPGHLAARPGGAKFFAPGHRQTMPGGAKTIAPGHRMR